MKKTYDITYSTEIESKHPIWAKPYSNGKIKAFFVPSARFGREVVELIQRMDVDFETVTIDRAWDINKWGIGDYYDVRGAIWDFRVVYENLENVLTSDEEFDVMVIPGINGWGFFSEKTRKAILDRVEKGAGLVLIQPFNGKDLGEVEELNKLSPLKCLYEEGFASSKNAGDGFPDIAFDKLAKGKWTPEEHYITSGIPFEVFPYNEMAYYPYEANGEVIIKSETGEPIAAVKEYGKGRIVAYGYYPRNILPQHSDFTGAEFTFDPIIENWAGARHSLTFNYLEYFYSLIYKSMIWAAGKEPKAKIKSAEVKDGKLCIELSDKNVKTISFRINDQYDNVVYEGKSDLSEIVLPEWLKLGGEFRLDVFLKDAEKVLDWSTVAFSRPLTSSIKGIVPGAVLFQVGETLTSEVLVEGTEGILDIQIIDDFGRALKSLSYKVSDCKNVKLSFAIKEMKSLHLRVRAEISIDGHIIQREESERLLVTPLNRKLNDFEVFMAPQNRGQGDFLELVGERFRDMGVTGLFPGSERMVALSGAEGMGIYWYSRMDYTKRKEMYLKTKDKKYLNRIPCLNDKEFWHEAKENIIKTVNENKKYGPVSYFANDEGSLTCYVDALDVCFCPNCLREMREWLKGEYKDLAEMNKVWGTNYGTWEEVVPYTYEEAKKSNQFAPWGDHRRFMEKTFANSYKKITEYIKEADPEGIARMSGCQASTAHSGYDYYQLHKSIDYFEAYPVGNQYEFHRSFAKPGTIIGGWFGYGRDGYEVKHGIWHAIYHELALISIFWEYCCLNPDYTFGKSATDMGEVFREIRREGIGKLLLNSAKRDNLGIAVHYSMPSIHGTYMMDAQKRFEDNRQGWLDMLEDLGYQYTFIASQQIEIGELNSNGYKVLILPYSIALSEKEAVAIRKFAEDGGVVIGDLQTAIMDEHCKTYDSGKLDDVFGITRLNTDARLFFTNDGYSTKKDFPYFNFELSHIPGRDYDGTGLAAAEIGVRENTGKAAYVDDFMNSVASVVVNEFGKGKGIYLNFSLDKYPSMRNNDGVLSIKEIIKNIFTLTNIEKFAVLKTIKGEIIDKNFETFYYSDKSAKYIGVLKGLAATGMGTGHDGLAVGGGKDVKTVYESVEIALAEKAHVYDIRDKKYLGYCDLIATEIESGDTKIFSLLPHSVDAILINSVDNVSRGDALKIEIDVKSDKQEGSYSSVLNIQVCDPDNNYAWIYSDNVSINSLKYVKTLDIPFNEKTGQWKIIVKDVATGVFAEKAFKII